MASRTFVLGPEFDLFEDDVPVGPSWHQDAIGALFQGLTCCGLKQGLPWLIGNRLPMIIGREDSDTLLHLVPDIIVHPTLTDAPRLSLDIMVDGPPVLAVEVVSTATEDSDLNITDLAGKPQLYAAAGIREYLAFDPLAEFIREQVRAWFLGPHGIIPWLPDANGRWVSATLGVSFAVQGALLRVYDQDDRLVPIYREAMNALALRDREIAALQAELRRLRGQ
jgi:Uma2 family endonuclease